MQFAKKKVKSKKPDDAEVKINGKSG